MHTTVYCFVCYQKVIFRQILQGFVRAPTICHIIGASLIMCSTINFHVIDLKFPRCHYSPTINYCLKGMEIQCILTTMKDLKLNSFYYPPLTHSNRTFEDKNALLPRHQLNLMEGIDKTKNV